MGWLFGSHRNLGLGTPVDMTVVIQTMGRGDIGSRVEVGYITIDGVESLRKIQRVDHRMKEEKESAASLFQDR